MVLLLPAGLAHPPVAHSAFPGRNGHIAFSRWRNHNWDIYRMRPNGDGLRKLTDNPRPDLAPSFSPSGNRIAFQSGDDQECEIYVKHAIRGSHERQLTHNSAADFDPAFSGPRGNRIAFVSDRGHPDQADLYVMRADGSHVRRVAGSNKDELAPAFSPDGRRIAYTSWKSGRGDIYVMRANGTHKHRLTAYPNQEFGADFSPNGKRITFTRRMGSSPGGHFEVFVMRADGTHKRRLTSTHGGFNGNSVFSPNGNKLAFQTPSEIAVMRADGSHRHILTLRGVDGEPSWGVKPERSRRLRAYVRSYVGFRARQARTALRWQARHQLLSPPAVRPFAGN